MNALEELEIYNAYSNDSSRELDVYKRQVCVCVCVCLLFVITLLLITFCMRPSLSDVTSQNP